MTSTLSPIPTTTRSDIWVVIGAAIAGTLPAPKAVRLFGEGEYGPHLTVDCLTIADAERWALWLGETTHSALWIEANKATAHQWAGKRSGWRWYIDADVPDAAVAVLTPDSPSLPEGVEGKAVGGRS